MEQRCSFFREWFSLLTMTATSKWGLKNTTRDFTEWMLAMGEANTGIPLFIALCRYCVFIDAEARLCQQKDYDSLNEGLGNG